MNKQEYLQLMSNEYFDICKDKSVLEIGPNTTIHTDLIIKHKPKYLTLIEADKHAASLLSTVVGVDKVIDDDAVYILHNKNYADVVVCCGVLYHLHSPLHLIELIVNNCNPEYLILDCVIDKQKIECLPEEDNRPGNRYTRPNWKSAKFNLVIPFDIINIAMKNMGYELVKKNKIQVVDYSSKIDSWVAMWKNNETK